MNSLAHFARQKTYFDMPRSCCKMFAVWNARLRAKDPLTSRKKYELREKVRFEIKALSIFASFACRRMRCGLVL
jgi:hypothetical protein